MIQVDILMARKKSARTGQLVLKAQQAILALIPSDLSALSSNFDTLNNKELQS